jgi:hypothetical protein
VTGPLPHPHDDRTHDAVPASTGMSIRAYRLLGK